VGKVYGSSIQKGGVWKGMACHAVYANNVAEVGAIHRGLGWGWWGRQGRAGRRWRCRAPWQLQPARKAVVDPAAKAGSKWRRGVRKRYSKACKRQVVYAVCTGTIGRNGMNPLENAGR